MKKIIAAFMAVILIIGSVGCSSGPKYNKYLSEDAIDAGEKALSFLQEFMDGTMDAKTVYEKLERIADELGDEDFYDSLMRIRISTLASCVFNYNSIFGTTSKKDIQDEIDEFKEFLYQ